MRRWVILASLFLLVLLSITILPVAAANPPNASFISNVTSGTAPLPFSFSDSSTGGAPTGWPWFFGDETYAQAWTQQNHSAGWRVRLFPTRVAAPDSSKALLSPSGAQGTRSDGNGADPFAVIDEKLVPSEAAGLKSLIRNTLHAFSYDAATGDWYARNAANQITFTYTRAGTAEFSEGENAFGLTLLGIGRSGGISPAGKGIVQALSLIHI